MTGQSCIDCVTVRCVSADPDTSKLGGPDHRHCKCKGQTALMADPRGRVGQATFTYTMYL